MTEGSWAYDNDYVWLSNYEWGWVPFHYGRWAWVDGRWGWVPGRVYAGAWVTWRTGPEGYGYVGWGPMAPTFGWQGGVAYRLAATVTSKPSPVVFLASDALFAPRVATRIVVGEQLATIAAPTRPYVRAEGAALGRSVAQGMAHGPPPAALGIQASAVVRIESFKPERRAREKFRAPFDGAPPRSAPTRDAQRPCASSPRNRARRGGPRGASARAGRAAAQSPDARPGWPEALSPVR